MLLMVVRVNNNDSTAMKIHVVVRMHARQCLDLHNNRTRTSNFQHLTFNKKKKKIHGTTFVVPTSFDCTHRDKQNQHSWRTSVSTGSS